MMLEKVSDKYFMQMEMNISETLKMERKMEKVSLNGTMDVCIMENIKITRWMDLVHATINSIEVGKINEVDLNNDGKNEVVFFEKRENINNEVGFTVLESKDDESKDALYTESGDKIKYANFYDLDNDGNKEIILVVEEKNETTLTICRYENGEIKELIF